MVDPCRSGNGAVLNTEIRDGIVVRIIVNETGTGYLPPKATAPQYPAILQLSEVRVNEPGINYDSGNDEIVIEPANGTQLSYTVEPFGKISGVKVLQAGNFTELPTIKMKTKTGINASFTPVFDVVRDPIEPVAKDIVQVFDLVGLNINGYVGGKEYYGNVYFKNGVKFAGTSTRSGTNIRVFESREASISGVNVPVARTVRQDQTIRTSTPITQTETISAEPSITQPSTYVPPSPSPSPSPSPAPAPAPSPSPAPSPTPPPSPPPSGGGGYGGY